MKICFLAPATSAHIKKWCGYFVSKGHEVHVVSFANGDIDGVKVHWINNDISPNASDIDKIKYLLLAKKIKIEINSINPDILNVHYATSYGTVAALSGLKQYVLSVWGSDIYDFPQRSTIHKKMLEYSLKKATWLFSTSNAMAEEAGKYTDKKFYITPFGVNCTLFNPDKRKRTTDDGRFIVGTVKGLSKVYGIDYLLKAVSIVHAKYPKMNIQLRIAGNGPYKETLIKMAHDLDINDIVTWLGFISQQEAAAEWADMDLAVVYSSGNESFGVSAVEAQACGCPIIISDVPGLMEATNPSVSSEVVKRCDENLLADKIAELVFDEEKRKRMGSAGRKYVLDKYEYNLCFSNIEKIFEQILTGEK